MDLVIAGTKLQCLIAREMISKGVISRSFILVLLPIEGELSAPRVEPHYRTFLIQSSRAVIVISHAEPYLYALGRLLLWSFVASGSGGRCFTANINSYLVAGVIWVNKWLPLVTFDEGAYNIKSGRVLFDRSPLDGTNLKRRIAQLLFPQGATAFTLSRALHHYTIFEGIPNVAGEKARCLGVQWQEYLDELDRDRLPPRVNRIMIGACLQGFPDRERALKSFEMHNSTCHMFLPHPRDKVIGSTNNRFEFDSPAEAIVQHYAEMGEVLVFHFDSTIEYTLRGKRNIALCNLRG
jgi:hypothetical protein